MNWEAIGALGEILGALVVVVTIFYLAVQVRHSRHSNQVVAASRIAEASDIWLRQLVQDADLLEVYLRGFEDYESLQGLEKARFAFLIIQFLRAVEGAWTQKELGVITDDQWYGYVASVRRIVGSPGGVVAFGKVRDVFSPSFRGAIEQIISGEA